MIENKCMLSVFFSTFFEWVGPESWGLTLWYLLLNRKSSLTLAAFFLVDFSLYAITFETANVRSYWFLKIYYFLILLVLMSGEVLHLTITCLGRINSSGHSCFHANGHLLSWSNILVLSLCLVSWHSTLRWRLKKKRKETDVYFIAT